MIKEILYNLLTDDQRKQIFYAFENEISQLILLPDNKFIGVNLAFQDNLVVEEIAGAWSYGTVR